MTSSLETEGGTHGDHRSYVGTVFTWVDKLGLRGILACKSVELGREHMGLPRTAEG